MVLLFKNPQACDFLIVRMNKSLLSILMEKARFLNFSFGLLAEFKVSQV